MKTNGKVGIWQWVQGAFVIFPLLPTWGGLGFVAAIAWVFWRRWNCLLQKPLNWAWLGLSFWSILVTAFAHLPGEAWLGLANFLPFFALFAAISSLVRSPAQLRRLAWLYTFAAVAIAVLGLGQVLAGWTTPKSLAGVLGWVLVPDGSPERRLASVFLHANMCAAYLAIALSLSLGLWCESYREWRRSSRLTWQLPGLTVAVLAIAAALYLTNSRNAWAIATLIGLAYAASLRWWWLIAAAGASIAGILWASFGVPPTSEWMRQVVPDAIWLRLSDQLYPDRPVETLRLTQWAFAWDLTWERPLTGWGLRNFTVLYREQTGVWFGHPHNLLLMLTAETGIPTAMMLVAIVGGAIALAVRIWRVWPEIAPTPGGFRWHQDRLIFFSFLMAFASCTLFNSLDVTVFDFRLNLLAWVLLGSIYGVAHRYRHLLLWEGK